MLVGCDGRVNIYSLFDNPEDFSRCLLDNEDKKVFEFIEYRVSEVFGMMKLQFG
jgi:hypothetical protein